ncbi:MAG: hypothetical protein HY000_20760, partial [Planctomycetes bacterium]|nr:hypothetical protein [Planctomycetota bacterium]
QPDQGPIPTADPIRSLVCSATLVGPNFRAAIIGDAVYRVGQKVPSKGPIQYVLKEVLPDRVLLEREGRVESLRIHPHSVDDDQEGQ